MQCRSSRFRSANTLLSLVLAAERSSMWSRNRAPTSSMARFGNLSATTNWMHAIFFYHPPQRRLPYDATSLGWLEVDRSGRIAPSSLPTTTELGNGAEPFVVRAFQRQRKLQGTSQAWERSLEIPRLDSSFPTTSFRRTGSVPSRLVWPSITVT